jgi:hypothetical protein
LDSLGEDAVDLSVGAQDYRVGDGFLIADGASDGGERGALWISPRTAFALTAIARLRTGPFSGEAVWLTPNDDPDSDTELAGVNGEWAFGESASVGLGYWYFYDSESPRRDGLHVVDLRGRVAPLHRLPGLVLAGEVAHERNGRWNDSWGGHVEAGYDFESCAWKPYISYRFSSFTGDEQSPDEIEAFDPIFYGFDDWGTWYQGELLGEYVALNRNLLVHTVRARIEPHESLTLTLLYFHYRLDDLASELVSRFAPILGEIAHREVGDEVDLAVDWEVGEHVAFSAALAAFVPAKGAEDFFGDDETWLGFQIVARLRF